MLLSLAATALGGFIGGVGRYLLKNLIATPTATLIANTLACGILGLTFRYPLEPLLLALVAAGVAGALSTWSTLAGELAEKLKTRPLDAAGYLGVTVGLGLVVFLACAGQF